MRVGRETGFGGRIGKMFFMDRSRKAEQYPWLEWKVRLFAIAAALAVGGMATGMDWLVSVGTGVLVLAFVVRFFPGGKGEVEEEQSEGAIDPNGSGTS
jgi:hypothetical protein